MPNGSSYDIFISYAHVDDQEIIEEKANTKWITTFRNTLETLIEKRLGRQGTVRIMMDVGGLARHGSVTPAIRKAIKESKTLVVFYSEGYRHSSWCNQELELFIEAWQDEQIAGERIFVVHLDDHPRKQWSSVFRDSIGYEFFHRDQATNEVTQLGFPAPTENDKKYFEKLNRLSFELANFLKESSEFKTTPAISPTLPIRNVFLAEVFSPDLDDERDSLLDYLQDFGCRVFPAKSYPRSPAAYIEYLKADLDQAILFVQLLDRFGSKRAEDLPNGYEGLQLEHARRQNIPILRWRHQELDLAAVKDSKHRSFIDQPDVMAVDISEFKKEVQKQLHRVQVSARLSPGPSQHLVLIDASDKDKDLANDIAEKFRNHQIDYHFVGKSDQIEELTSVSKAQGLLIIYGECAVDWAKRRCMAIRRMLLSASQSLHCGVFIEPPPGETKEPLGISYQGLRIIEGRNFLEVFIDVIKNQGASA